MTAAKHFSADYAEARRRFRDAAQAAGARLDCHDHPLRGPAGEALACDTAWLGPPDAERVLVSLSATHGVEGFCGSGVQLGWLESGLWREVPGGCAQLLVHAINPHGFAWLRRVTEDNVDLNRNFVDHDAPYPVNAGYEALKEALCPAEWNEAVIVETQRTLQDYAERHGLMGLQTAISGGQYRHREGIFFGGRAPTWSRQVLESIFREKLTQARRVAVVDYHTGLGPYGHGERICVHPPGSPGLQRAARWYQGDITSPALGTSTSSELSGVNEIGMAETLPEAELTCIALEYGTLSRNEVRLALCADNWLHHHGDPDSNQGRAIKAQIRAAFYPDADDWKEAVWNRAVETQKLAIIPRDIDIHPSHGAERSSG